MARGRKHAPIAQKAAAELPPPEHLNTAARAEWRRVVKLLAPAKTLHELDRSALAMYCNYVALWLECQRDIDANGPVIRGGMGGLIKNPHVLVQKDCWDAIRTLIAELGFTPAARAKLGIFKAEADDPTKADKIEL
ncbi:MAG: phage terminase small subunit P27 family [Tepidisphaeraceae bacterium]